MGQPNGASSIEDAMCHLTGDIVARLSLQGIHLVRFHNGKEWMYLLSDDDGKVYPLAGITAYRDLDLFVQNYRAGYPIRNLADE